MILLSDNDVLIKLSQCDLIDEFLAACGCTYSQCHVLNEAQFSLYLDNPDKCIAKRVGNSSAYERLYQFVMSCSRLGAAAEDIDFLEEISVIASVDPGEQALFLHAYNMHNSGSEYYIATGDKRALSGIHQSTAERAKKILTGRVECTESLALKFIDIFGFELINSKVSCAASTTDRFDSVLRMAFGEQRDESHARGCLQNYLAPIAHFIRS